MLDYNSNNRDWLHYKLSKLGIYNTFEASTLVSSTNRTEIAEAVKALEQRDDIYKEGHTYYQFEKKELKDEDKTFIDLKLLDELQNINDNIKSIKDNVNNINPEYIKKIDNINYNAYIIKNCMIFFIALTIISIIMTIYSSFKAAKSLDDIDSIYSYQQEYSQNFNL